LLLIGLLKELPRLPFVFLATFALYEEILDIHK